MKNQNYLPRRANLVNIFLNLLAADKAIYSKFWNFHWISNGKSFYSKHLMFQRIYDETKEEIDGLAEKFVALFGSENLNYKDLCDLEFKYIKDFDAEPLQIQIKYTKYLLQTKKFLKSKDLGDSALSNIIQTMIDKHITHIYLLKQGKEKNKDVLKENKMIDKKLIRKVNRQLEQGGFNENKFFEKPQQAWSKAVQILEENGITVDDEEFFTINNHFVYHEKDINSNLNVGVSYNNDGKEENSRLHFSWHRPIENEIYKIKVFCYVVS